MPRGDDLARRIRAAIKLSANLDVPSAEEVRNLTATATADLLAAGVAADPAGELAGALVAGMARFAGALATLGEVAEHLQAVMESFVREMEEGDENA